jgi:hypothetical protein
MGGALSIDSPTPDLKNNLYRLQNVSNNFKFHLEKCIQANGGTFEQELQEGTIFHNDAIVGKSFTTEPFFQVWKQKIIRGGE